MNVEITSTLEWFSTHLTIIARMYKLFTGDLGGDLGEDLGGDLGEDLRGDLVKGRTSRMF